MAGSRKRPGGFGMLLLTGASLILPATALLVTAVDSQARAATVFAAATPIVLGAAIVVVLVCAIAIVAGRPRPAAGIGLIVAAAVFAVTGLGLLVHGPAVMTAGVVLLPSVITTLVLARPALSAGGR